MYITFNELRHPNWLWAVLSIAIAVPTAPASAQSCDPNYTGACVPIASDVDCGGGSGNGPAYVHYQVRVVGRDIYKLDRDGNGIGCEHLPQQAGFTLLPNS